MLLRSRHPVIISAPYRLLRLLTLLRISEKYPQKGALGTHLRLLRIWRCGAPLLSLGTPHDVTVYECAYSMVALKNKEWPG